MPAKPKMLKLHGRAEWAWLGYAEDGRITRAIVRNGNELSIDADCGEYRYSVKLNRRDGDFFEGAWSCIARGETVSDQASATLYNSSSGYLLFGKWREEDYEYYWWAELAAVDHFADEVRS